MIQLKNICHNTVHNFDIYFPFSVSLVTYVSTEYVALARSLPPTPTKRMSQ